MGIGLVCECDKCNHSISISLGVGFSFPMVYEETVKKMKSGEYGEQPKSFFVDHPDGAISCDRIPMQCSECHALYDDLSLCMYVPKDGYSPREKENSEESSIPWSSAVSGEGCEFVAPSDISQNYVLFQEYEHKCPKCGGKAEIFMGFESKLHNGKLQCPKCKEGVMRDVGSLMWD